MVELKVGVGAPGPVVEWITHILESANCAGMCREVSLA